MRAPNVAVSEYIVPIIGPMAPDCRHGGAAFSSTKLAFYCGMKFSDSTSATEKDERIIDTLNPVDTLPSRDSRRLDPDRSVRIICAFHSTHSAFKPPETHLADMASGYGLAGGKLAWLIKPELRIPSTNYWLSIAGRPNSTDTAQAHPAAFHSGKSC